MKTQALRTALFGSCVAALCFFGFGAGSLSAGEERAGTSGPSAGPGVHVQTLEFTQRPEQKASAQLVDHRHYGGSRNSFYFSYGGPYYGGYYGYGPRYYGYSYYRPRYYGYSYYRPYYYGGYYDTPYYGYSSYPGYYGGYSGGYSYAPPSYYGGYYGSWGYGSAGCY